MTFQIRDAIKSDMPEVLALIRALALFEKEPDAVDIDVADLESAAFDSPKKFTCFVAQGDRGLIGMALIYFRFSTWKGPVVHLEDLIVHQSYRGQGVGTALYRSVMEFAQAQGVKRVNWEVLHWNTAAISFYEKTGAHVSDQWQTVSMSETGLKKYLES